eukprot:g1754.t1
MCDYEDDEDHTKKGEHHKSRKNHNGDGSGDEEADGDRKDTRANGNAEEGHDRVPVLHYIKPPPLASGGCGAPVLRLQSGKKGEYSCLKPGSDVTEGVVVPFGQVAEFQRWLGITCGVQDEDGDGGKTTGPSKNEKQKCKDEQDQILQKCGGRGQAGCMGERENEKKAQQVDVSASMCGKKAEYLLSLLQRHPGDFFLAFFSRLIPLKEVLSFFGGLSTGSKKALLTMNHGFLKMTHLYDKIVPSWRKSVSLARDILKPKSRSRSDGAETTSAADLMQSELLGHAYTTEDAENRAMTPDYVLREFPRVAVTAFHSADGNIKTFDFSSAKSYGQVLQAGYLRLVYNLAKDFSSRAALGAAVASWVLSGGKKTNVALQRVDFTEFTNTVLTPVAKLRRDEMTLPFFAAFVLEVWFAERPCGEDDSSTERCGFFHYFTVGVVPTPDGKHREGFILSQSGVGGPLELRSVSIEELAGLFDGKFDVPYAPEDTAPPTSGKGVVEPKNNVGPLQVDWERKNIATELVKYAKPIEVNGFMVGNPVDWKKKWNRLVLRNRIPAGKMATEGVGWPFVRKIWKIPVHYNDADKNRKLPEAAEKSSEEKPEKMKKCDDFGSFEKQKEKQVLHIECMPKDRQEAWCKEKRDNKIKVTPYSGISCKQDWKITVDYDR